MSVQESTIGGSAGRCHKSNEQIQGSCKVGETHLSVWYAYTVCDHLCADFQRRSMSVFRRSVTITECITGELSKRRTDYSQTSRGWPTDIIVGGSVTCNSLCVAEWRITTALMNQLCNNYNKNTRLTTTHIWLIFTIVNCLFIIICTVQTVTKEKMLACLERDRAVSEVGD